MFIEDGGIMILWINGTYCVGKTDVSGRLKEKFSADDVELLELDNYSDFIMGKILKNPKESNNNSYSDIEGASQFDIQFYEEFRKMIEEKAHKMLIIDTAITDKVCKDIVFDDLSKKYDDLLHVILVADEDTIKSRIRNDDKRKQDDKLFALTNLKSNLSFMEKNFKDAVWIKTDDRDIDSIVDEIIELVRFRKK